MDGRLDPGRSFLDKVLLFLSDRYLDQDGRSFHDIAEFAPDATYVPEARTDRLLLLRAAPTADRVTVEAIRDSELSTALRAIHHYEWNERLAEYYLSFDALFPSAEKARQLERLRTVEERIFEDLLAGTSTALVNVPRERDWAGSGVTDGILEVLRRHPEPTSGPSAQLGRHPS